MFIISLKSLALSDLRHNTLNYFTLDLLPVLADVCHVYPVLCAPSSPALQHHDHHLDLHGSGVGAGGLPRHHHLQETARLHFTTLPIAAVCGTLSYATLP